MYSLCAAAYLPLLSICSSQTHPPPLTCHSHYASFLGEKKKKKKASQDREAPATKHRNERHKHQHRYTLLDNIRTQNTWSRVQKHAHRQTHVCAHTQSYQPVKSCEATAVCLFVCVAVSGVFVIQHDRARSLWGPLIPLVEMKCNGADSIRALPPQEKKTKKNGENQITPNPSEPSQHSLLPFSWEGKTTMGANSLGSLHAYSHTTGMECDTANVEG